MTLSDELRRLLGFDTRDVRLTNVGDDSVDYEGDYVGDIAAGKQVMFVYCGLVHCVPVGDTQAPLLRIINVERGSGSIYQKYFEKPRYLPVQKRHFDTVEVDIRNDYGETMAFDAGKLIITLHFRRVKGNYFS